MTVVECIKRCLARPAFLDRFYELFLANGEVRDRFGGANLSRVKFHLAQSLMVLVRQSYGAPGSGARLAETADLHGPAGMDIPDRLYRYWIDAFVRAVREVDPDVDEASLDRLRRSITDAVTEFAMRSRNEAPAPPGM